MSKKTNFPSEKELKEMRELLSKGDASRLLPKNASATDKVKFLICEKILDYKLSNKLTQRALSEKLGENESLVSKVVHYHIDEFTIDRLLKFLNVIYPNMTIDLKVA
jgi:predicted XRE-type DNA-binding protein